mmetsp:Transcript_101451/g.310216  ORF Transcript_101451/g.310216 Transcript_101451/m.310216 type:complete len:206 (+) Transcript_101451:153-770(+)
MAVAPRQRRPRALRRQRHWQRKWRHIAMHQRSRSMARLRRLERPAAEQLHRDQARQASILLGRFRPHPRGGWRGADRSHRFCRVRQRRRRSHNGNRPPGRVCRGHRRRHSRKRTRRIRRGRLHRLAQSACRLLRVRRRPRPGSRLPHGRRAHCMVRASASERRRSRKRLCRTGAQTIAGYSSVALVKGQLAVVVHSRHVPSRNSQ